MDLKSRLRDALGSPVRALSPLSGGCVADVRRADLEDGRIVVVKAGDMYSGLALEGDMLEDLARLGTLPVPGVHVKHPDLLVMEHLPSGGSLNASAQVHAADLVAGLHGVSGDCFGYKTDTVIGGLPQPNPPHDAWIPFFRDWRLMYMGKEAHRVNRLPAATLARLESLCSTLETRLLEPDHPSLIHGDMWGGNVLAANGKITGFIDPAIHYAHPEIELAFTTLFSTFGDPFFARYREHRPLSPGFFEERLDIYNLYPLLVHVRLFGGHYVSQVERTLSFFGH